MPSSTEGISAKARIEHGARAGFVSCLAILFEAPKDWPEDLLARLAAALEPLPFALRHAGSELVSHLDALWGSNELALGHARLFLGPTEVLAPPYASNYLQTDGSLMGPVSEAVERQFREAGLVEASGPREAPDHASRELEFYGYLLAECAGSGDPVWEQRLYRFHQHGAAWWPQLAERIQSADAPSGLRELGHLLALFSESEAARMART